MSADDKRILLGEITGAHGVRGEILVRSYTADPMALADYGPLSDAAGNAPLQLKLVRMTPKGGIVARIKGVSDRNGAEALKGRKLYVAREAMPEPDAEDDFYYEDLIGLAAIDASGAVLGEVVAVQNYGAGDLIEIRLTGGRKTELIPFTRAFVPVVDVAGGRVVVELPVASADDDDDGHDAALKP